MLNEWVYKWIGNTSDVPDPVKLLKVAPLSLMELSFWSCTCGSPTYESYRIQGLGKAMTAAVVYF